MVMTFIDALEIAFVFVLGVLIIKYVSEFIRKKKK